MTVYYDIAFMIYSQKLIKSTVKVSPYLWPLKNITFPISQAKRLAPTITTTMIENISNCPKLALPQTTKSKEDAIEL